ncbi:Transcriptional regulator, MarR family [Marinobacterium lacunae]|uniref:Transcriptional regulator, MarR family n=1 Tax=Marinobacterium lacunae TaxID=1232683 RepID=A0A081FYQ6_9GAMM|nr:MarR family transcriptional regulator [Marinobacterium lacunae]KEA63661.1 Transcriptional regulator, MarR family [Marinobacterium lacunae]MBR9884509.1 MarR family transcriptional regulator [Oceanospirillales bacterium]
MSSSQGATDEISFGVLGEMLGYRLRRAQLTFFNNFSSVCSDLGVSPGLFGVLSIAKENPGLTQTAVAQALGNDRSAMVAAVDRLEKLELIERRPSKKDRRSYALYLTEHGERFYEDLVNRVQRHEEQLCERLKPGEKEWLLEVLGRFSS